MSLSFKRELGAYSAGDFGSVNNNKLRNCFGGWERETEREDTDMDTDTGIEYPEPGQQSRLKEKGYEEMTIRWRQLGNKTMDRQRDLH